MLIVPGQNQLSENITPQGTAGQGCESPEQTVSETSPTSE